MKHEAFVPGGTMRFIGKRVLVTGAAAGIGRAIGEAFAREGALVCFTDFRRDALAALEEQRGDETPAIFDVLDVQRRDEVHAVVARVVQTWGGVDILVNNAGVYPNTLVVDMTEEDWDRVIDTNLKGPFLTCQAVAKDMIARKEGGQIINITSGAQDTTRIGSGHYASSKAALFMFTRTLALELAPYQINVNAVAPGFTAVPGTVSPLLDEYRDAITQTIPLGRAAEPEEIASAVLFMASPDAAFITGTVLKVDGGRGAGHFALPRSQ